MIFHVDLSPYEPASSGTRVMQRKGRLYCGRYQVRSHDMQRTPRSAPSVKVAPEIAWPDYACSSCGFLRSWEVRRCVNQAGQETFVFVCSACGTRTRHFVPKRAVAAVGIEPEDIEPTGLRHTCEVCGAEGAESHHWAPSFIFGDEADRWPRSFLCVPCHVRWHSLVTPQMGSNSGV
jgi:hypothetical protein